MEIWFDRDALLGQGGFGLVFKGKFGGREVAVKRVELRHVDKREEDAMLKLKHPNIVKLLYCEKDNDFMYYALELCVASLDQLFLKSADPKKYKGPMLHNITICRQLAVGLEYIHSMQLIHRDIKPGNVLICVSSTGQGDNITIKWSDFGLAKSVNEKGLHTWTGAKGTHTWYAPEVLEKLINGEKAEQEEFWGTVQSDVFVLGLVFGYLFLKGEHLYGSSKKEIHKNIIEKNPVNMQKLDEKLRQYYADDLLMKMLEDDPKKRITSKEVVKQLESINNMLTKKEEEMSWGGGIGGDFKCKLYFYPTVDEPTADETDTSDYWITDQELREKLSELIDTDEEIQNASVYSNPLSTLQLINNKLYHAFIIMETNNWWWSIEKNTEGITIQRSKKLESVRDMYQRKKRTTGLTPWTGIQKIKTTQGRNTTINELINYIWRIDVLNQGYHVLSTNCQEFAALLFDRINLFSIF